jgi:putative Mg2+ transporter-C (MgtC) family protein
LRLNIDYDGCNMSIPLGQWHDWVKFLFQISLAYILTAIIGWNREREEHTAGIRTFPIVGMASCGFLLVIPTSPDFAAQSRLMQGLIAGIGFVGGGVIFKEGSTVKGMATAASIWNAAVIGVAIAMERYDIAIVLSLLNLFTLRVLLPLKTWLDRQP